MARSAIAGPPGQHPLNITKRLGGLLGSGTLGGREELMDDKRAPELVLGRPVVRVKG